MGGASPGKGTICSWSVVKEFSQEVEWDTKHTCSNGERDTVKDPTSASVLLLEPAQHCIWLQREGHVTVM